MSSISVIVKQPQISSLHFKVLTGTASSVANSATANLSISGFDANYVSALSGNAFTVPPGVYDCLMKASFGMPATGSGNSYCTLAVSTNSSGATVSPTQYQTSYGFNGWQVNNGTDVPFTTAINAPQGATLTPTFLNALGATISSVSVSITLMQKKAY